MTYLLDFHNEAGELIDVALICSDWCHIQYCKVNGYAPSDWDARVPTERPYLCAYCQYNLKGTNEANTTAS